MIHRNKVEKYGGTMKDLAEEVGNLRYDALAEFLKLLAAKIKNDGDKDEGRGRVQLAGHLHDCSAKLVECNLSIKAAWKVCKPYMEQ